MWQVSGKLVLELPSADAVGSVGLKAGITVFQRHQMSVKAQALGYIDLDLIVDLAQVVCAREQTVNLPGPSFSHLWNEHRSSASQGCYPDDTDDVFKDHWLYLTPPPTAAEYLH